MRQSLALSSSNVVFDISNYRLRSCPAQKDNGAHSVKKKKEIKVFCHLINHSCRRQLNH